MERRRILRLASALPLSAVAGAGEPSQRPLGHPSACRVAVLRKTFNKEWVDLYRGGKGEICPVFQEGQVFTLASPWEAPQGFCQWAWADIRGYVMGAAFGREGTMVACCSDGFRPVFFKIERLES